MTNLETAYGLRDKITFFILWCLFLPNISVPFAIFNINFFEIILIFKILKEPTLISAYIQEFQMNFM